MNLDNIQMTNLEARLHQRFRLEIF